MSGASSVSMEREPTGAINDLRDWTMQQRAVGRCLFCPEWEVTGTVEEIEQFSREHRLEVHPDLKPTRRRQRANLGRWRSTISAIDSAEIHEERTKRLRLLGITPEET